MSIGMLGRIPPQAIEAEQSVLGSIMLESVLFDDVLEILQAGDFYREDHREIFEAMNILNLETKTIDVITVAEILKTKGILDVIGGYEYLSILANGVPTTTNVIHYSNIVKEKSILRKFINSSNDIINICYDQSQDIESVVQLAESQILEVNQDKKQDMCHVSQALSSTLTEIERRCKNKGQIEGILTGLTDLDYKLRGLKKGDLILIAARPSMGKTALVENISD